MAEADEVPEFTCNEAVDTFVVGQGSVEFIGYVDSIGEDANWGNMDTNRRFKFTLNNGQGTRLSICAWNQEAPKVAGIVQFDQIVYLEGVNVTQPKRPSYNTGNRPFELTIRGNTVVTTYGFYSQIRGAVAASVPEVPLVDLLNHHKKIATKGYVKTAFRESNLSNQRSTIIGVITDLYYQIEVRISSGSVKKSFNKGDYIKLTGTVVHSFTPPHLGVESYTDIELIDDVEKANFKSLQQGFRCLKKGDTANDTQKRVNESDDEPKDEAAKKMKSD